MRLNAARCLTLRSPVSMACTPAVAGAMDHAVEADRRDEKSSNRYVRSSFVVSAFHRTPPPRWNGFTMVTGASRPGNAGHGPAFSWLPSLTALLCAPDLLPTELHGRSRFSAGLLRPGDPFGRSPCRWLYLITSKTVLSLNRWLNLRMKKGGADQPPVPAPCHSMPTILQLPLHSGVITPPMTPTI